MIFLNSASSAAALVFYLPGVCTKTDTKGKQRKARVRNILKSLEKNTLFNEHPVGEVKVQVCRHLVLILVQVLVQVQKLVQLQVLALVLLQPGNYLTLAVNLLFRYRNVDRAYLPG